MDERGLLTECKNLEQGEEDEEEDCHEEDESKELDTATEQDQAFSSNVTDGSHCLANASSPLTSASDESTVPTTQQSNSQRQENCDKEHARHRRRNKRRKGRVDIVMFGMGSGSVVIVT